MAASKRNDTQIIEDRALIADMAIRNMTLRQMAMILNTREGVKYHLSFQQVDYDLKKIQEIWIKESMVKIELGLMHEIRKLDKIETECWQAWEESKHGRRSTRLGGGYVDKKSGEEIGGSLIERRIETSTGDVRYLVMIERCITKRAELLGIVSPKVPEGGMNIDNAIILMEKDTILQEIAKVCRKPLLIS
jgi:hypothetical protein